MKRKEKMKQMIICLIYYMLVAYNALARLPAAVSGNEHEGNTDQACVAGKYCLQNFLKMIIFYGF